MKHILPFLLSIAILSGCKKDITEQNHSSISSSNRDDQISSLVGKNLLTNPGFESGLTGWKFVSEGTLPRVVATGQHSGAHCLMIPDYAAGAVTQVIGGPIEGHRYQLTAWVNVMGTGTGAIGMKLTDNAGEIFEEMTSTLSQQFGYWQLGISIVAPPGATRVEIRVENDDVIKIKADDVRLVDLDSPCPKN
jgi:hypothetical protein